MCVTPCGVALQVPLAAVGARHVGGRDARPRYLSGAPCTAHPVQLCSTLGILGCCPWCLRVVPWAPISEAMGSLQLGVCARDRARMFGAGFLFVAPPSFVLFLPRLLLICPHTPLCLAPLASRARAFSPCVSARVLAAHRLTLCLRIGVRLRVRRLAVINAGARRCLGQALDPQRPRRGLARARRLPPPLRCPRQPANHRRAALRPRRAAAAAKADSGGGGGSGSVEGAWRRAFARRQCGGERVRQWRGQWCWEWCWAGRVGAGALPRSEARSGGGRVIPPRERGDALHTGRRGTIFTLGPARACLSGAYSMVHLALWGFRWMGITT